MDDSLPLSSVVDGATSLTSLCESAGLDNGDRMVNREPATTSSRKISLSSDVGDVVELSSSINTFIAPRIKSVRLKASTSASTWSRTSARVARTSCVSEAFQSSGACEMAAEVADDSISSSGENNQFRGNSGCVPLRCRNVVVALR